MKSVSDAKISRASAERDYLEALFSYSLWFVFISVTIYVMTGIMQAITYYGLRQNYSTVVEYVTTGMMIVSTLIISLKYVIAMQPNSNLLIFSPLREN